MATCAIDPGNKRLLAQRVGKHLVTLYGKRPSYSPTLVRAAMRRCQFPDIWDCWALSLFSSPLDFDSYHAATGESCDFASMHAEMLSAIGARIDMGSASDVLSFDWLDSGSMGADAGDAADLSSH